MESHDRFQAGDQGSQILASQKIQLAATLQCKGARLGPRQMKGDGGEWKYSVECRGEGKIRGQKRLDGTIPVSGPLGQPSDTAASVDRARQRRGSQVKEDDLSGYSIRNKIT